MEPPLPPGGASKASRTEEEESCLVGSITRPKEAGGSGVETGILAVTTGGSSGVPPGNTGISWGISVGRLVGMVPWTRDFGESGRGRINITLGMRSREWQQQAPTQAHAVSSDAKGYPAAPPACRLFTDLPIYLHCTESRSRLGSSVCKAELCTGHLNQLRLRNSAAEYTERWGQGNDRYSWSFSSELFGTTGVPHECGYITFRPKLACITSATLATKIQRKCEYRLSLQLPELLKQLRLNAAYIKYKEIKACPLFKIHPSFLLQHTYFYPQACFDSMDTRGQGDGNGRVRLSWVPFEGQLHEAADSKAGLECAH